MKTGASANRYRSKQDYETPRDFLEVVQHRFGTIDVDLAATRENAKASTFVPPEDDSLSDLCDWDAFADLFRDQKERALAWLNPPYSTIEPWARKCAYAERLHILLLIPASVGSNWWKKYVHGAADRVLFVSPRLSFDGKNPYPKDVVLVEYNAGTAFNGTQYECWSWR